MIRISREPLSKPLRWLPGEGSAEVHYFRRYGFTTTEALNSRVKLRGRAGAYRPEDRPVFSFQVEASAGNLRVRGLKDCRFEDGKIETALGSFYLGLVPPAAPAPLKTLEPQSQPRWPWIAPILILMAAAIPFFFGLSNETPMPEIAKTESIEPIILRPEPKPVEEVKPAQTAVDPRVKARRAVSAQLGFLGTLGKKDLKAATAGMPSEAAEKTAGAGDGGEAGSGGEMLAAMGRGLHQTTVGNTGVAGLGGIGKQGRGGGQGGYGDAEFGGAAGSGLSLPLDREAVVDEGLDRSQIQAAIMRYLAQVRACYEEGLKRNAGLIGQVVMNFEVLGQGQVGSSRVQRSSLRDRPVEDCIRTKMLSWKFPQPRGGRTVRVSYPFMLRPVRS